MVARIRKARRADCRELTRIAHAAKRHWGYPERWIRLWAPDLTVTPEFLAEHPVFCLVRYDRDGRPHHIVGFYALSGDGSCRELEHMWVDPRWIGAGMGRRLFAHLTKRLRRDGVTRLRIASDPHAEEFYRKLGARRVGSVASIPRGRRLALLTLRVPQPSSTE